jgi:hypothetical protein
VNCGVWICGGLTASLCVAAVAVAQEGGQGRARPYDGIQAGLDAFRLAEEQRQANVAQHLGLNEQLRYWPAWAGWSVVPGGGAFYVPVGPYFSAGGLPARQPIGQRQEQTGPNRWESHPVYSPPLTPYVPLPPVDSRWLDNTPYAAVRALPPPPAAATPPGPPEAPPLPPPTPDPPRRGPREY